MSQEEFLKINFGANMYSRLVDNVEYEIWAVDFEDYTILVQTKIGDFWVSHEKIISIYHNEEKETK